MATVATDELGRPILGRYTGPALNFGADEAGTLGPKSDVHVVLTSMYFILATPKGSVIYDLEIGSMVPYLLHEPLDHVTLGLIRYFVIKDLSEQEPRINIDNVTTQVLDEMSVGVTVSFSLVGDPRGTMHAAPMTLRRAA